MEAPRPPLFRKHQVEPTVIVTCVRWYLRFSLSLRDLEELMAERGLFVDHTTIWRWTQAYGPEVYRRLRGEVKRKSSTWHIDETFAHRRPLDVPVSCGRQRWPDSGLLFIGNAGSRGRHDLLEKKPWPILTIARLMCWLETACAAIQPRFENCRWKVNCTEVAPPRAALAINNQKEK